VSAAAPVRRIGVLGAGTMGAGIAQVSACTGAETLLYDPVAGAAVAGAERIRESLARGVARGRLSDGAVRAALGRLRTTDRFSDLFDRELVIEAAPEDLAIKREAFGELDVGCAPDAVLATNTSSIPVTQIAAAALRPQRVVGLHFFNPVPAMQLTEVIPAAQTSAATTAAAVAVAVQLGKHPIVATDSPGFLVNRCGRPFYTEALRIVAERIATPAQVDRICRMAGGFRMGPFELMDLVGIDVSLAVMSSFASGSFGEPRWRPSPLQARLVAAGHLGRKSGRGWYDYGGKRHRNADPEPCRPVGAAPALRLEGTGPEAARVRAMAADAGVSLTDDPAAPVLLADEACGVIAPAASLRLRSCASSSLVGHGDPAAVGFCLSLDPASAGLVELAGTRVGDPDAMAEAQRIFEALGVHVERVADGPGLVLQRILAQIVNEACFAAGEGIGSAADIDAGVKLGLNYPRGPFELGARMGFGAVRRTIDGLWVERREERYRSAPLLSEAALTGVIERG
jgi:3-hydroxybutyryl-CoA dehydrogenase